MTTLTISATSSPGRLHFTFCIDEDVVLEVKQVKKKANAVLRLHDGDAWTTVHTHESWSLAKAVADVLEFVEDKVVHPGLTYEWCTDDLLERLCTHEDEMVRAIPKGHR